MFADLISNNTKMAGEATNNHRPKAKTLVNNSTNPKRQNRKSVNKTPVNLPPEPAPLLGGDDGGNDPPTPATTATPEPPDPFDPASLRINPDTAAGAIGVKRKIVTVKVCKPNRQEFCRVHPDESYRIDTAVLEDERNRESYLVAPALWAEIPDEITLVRLCLAVTRHGTPFLWPAKLPDPDRPNDWHVSMLAAQAAAITQWTKVKSSMSDGSYAVFEATGNLQEPQWPDLSFHDILKLAFKTRFIDSINHPFLQELFGEV